MAKMTTAAGAHNLSAGHAETGVVEAGDSAGNCVEEGRPATAALELVHGAVQRRAAPRAPVHPVVERLVVLACEWRLGALLAQDLELLCNIGWSAHGSRLEHGGGDVTLREDGAPLVFGLLDGVGHFLGGAGRCAEE
jgi:hypothetical protein